MSMLKPYQNGSTAKTTVNRGNNTCFTVLMSVKSIFIRSIFLVLKKSNLKHCTTK